MTYYSAATTRASAQYYIKDAKRAIRRFHEITTHAIFSAYCLVSFAARVNSYIFHILRSSGDIS